MLRYYIGIPILFVALGVAYYGLSPLFINIKANDEIPANASKQESQSALVKGTVGHSANGTARIVEADGKKYVRYENFKTINGPDLFVYLAKDEDAKDFINLGSIKATEGNVNYEIPKGVNPAEYPYVLVWCRVFGVLFNSAKLY